MDAGIEPRILRTPANGASGGPWLQSGRAAFPASDSTLSRYQILSRILPMVLC